MANDTTHAEQVLALKQQMREIFLADIQLVYEAASALGEELQTDGLAAEKRGDTPQIVRIGYAYIFIFMIVRILANSGRIILIKAHQDVIDAAARMEAARK